MAQERRGIEGTASAGLKRHEDVPKPLTIGQPPALVDILQHIDGVSFDQAWENRIEGLVDGEVRTVVISRDDLIQNKLASGSFCESSA